MHFLCFKMREKIYIADRAHQESLARAEYKFYTARVRKRYEIIMHPSINKTLEIMHRNILHKL